jgi:hypothetical protein
MNKIFAVLFCGLLSVSGAIAFANENLPEADLELLLNFKDYCQEVADDEGTGDLVLTEFFLTGIIDF